MRYSDSPAASRADLGGAVVGHDLRERAGHRPSNIPRLQSDRPKRRQARRGTPSLSPPTPSFSRIQGGTGDSDGTGIPKDRLPAIRGDRRLLSSCTGERSVTAVVSLLRQPNGFEGVVRAVEPLVPDHLPVTHCP
jgi:hypothetical protein